MSAVTLTKRQVIKLIRSRWIFPLLSTFCCSFWYQYLPWFAEETAIRGLALPPCCCSKSRTGICSIVGFTLHTATSWMTLPDSKGIYSVWISEEVVLFRVNLDIFPAAALPSTGDKVHLRLIPFCIEVEVIFFVQILAGLWLLGTYVLHSGSPWLDVFNVNVLLLSKFCCFFVLPSPLCSSQLICIIRVVLIENILAGITQVLSARWHDSIWISSFNHCSCSVLKFAVNRWEFILF